MTGFQAVLTDLPAVEGLLRGWPPYGIGSQRVESRAGTGWGPW